MTTKPKPKRENVGDVASVNWEGIARFLGRPTEDAERVRQLELEPVVSTRTKR